jgi:hypothetical protein
MTKRNKGFSYAQILASLEGEDDDRLPDIEIDEESEDDDDVLEIEEVRYHVADVPFENGVRFIVLCCAPLP